MRHTLLFFFLISGCLHAAAQGFEDSSDSLGFENAYSFGEYGGGPSFVDFNFDGYDDVTIPRGSGENMDFHLSDGEDFELLEPFFENNNEIKQALWVDYDNDHDLDLYLTSKQKNLLFKNTGDFVFEDITFTCGFNDPSSQSFCSTWFDYNEDGLLDLMVGHRISHLVGHLTLYKNLGDDQFENLTYEAGIGGAGNSVLAMAAFDMNNDGWEDIYIVQDYEAGNLLYKNNGDGTFEDISEDSGTAMLGDGMSATIGDFNNDGWMDIYVTNTPGGNSLYVNQGDETFLELSADYDVWLNEFTFGAAWIDAENDGDLDLYINGNINSPIDNSKMMMNPGNGEPFENVTIDWNMNDAEDKGRGVAVGDFNDDGFPDLFKMNYPNVHTMWKNQFSENNYLKVDLRGTASNYMAVGAVIKVLADSLTQMRRIGCGEGWASQNSYTQFFGLGESESIDTLWVQWPNGLESVMTNIDVNQRLTIFETEMILGCLDFLACNYDSLATEDSGLCVYPLQYFNCEGNCLNDMDQDSICDELEIAGCQDPMACNYNLEATDDDGSCSYINDGEITGIDYPIAEESYTYSYPFSEGSTYAWTITNGVIVGGQGTNEVEALWYTGEGSLTVQESNVADCLGSLISFAVEAIVVSVKEQARFDWEIWPNPATDMLYVNRRNHNQDLFDITIRDIAGKEIMTVKNCKENQLLEIGELPVGLYFVQINTYTANFVERLVKW